MKRRAFLKSAAWGVLNALTGTAWGISASPQNHAEITIAGLGGCGVRLMARMVREYQSGMTITSDRVNYLAVDTDDRSLERDVPDQEQYGSTLRPIWIKADTPSCANPERGRLIAERQIDRLSTELRLDHCSLLILMLGIGRGCETGFAQSLAAHAQRQGITTVAFSILPFEWDYSFSNIDHELGLLNSSADYIHAFKHPEFEELGIRGQMALCERRTINKAMETLLANLNLRKYGGQN